MTNRLARTLTRAVLPLATLALAAGAVPAAAQYSDGYNFLKAVRESDLAKAKPLMDKPGSTIVNTRDITSGETALSIALKRKDAPWVALLLQGGADPNMKDGSGNTPLLVATASNFPDGVRLLLIKKARVNDSNSQGETPLIKAVHMNDLDSARLLLDAGADPDRADNLAGMSAREYAARDLRDGPLARLLADARKAGDQQTVGPQL